MSLRKTIEVISLKDLARVQDFLEQQVVDWAALKEILERHGLTEAWRSFCIKAGIENPLKLTQV